MKEIINNSIYATAATTTEMSERRRKINSQYNDQVRSDAAIAVLNKNSNCDSDSKGTLACVLPWGHGWGWATLPNGVWSGGLYESYLLLHMCRHKLKVKSHTDNTSDAFRKLSMNFKFQHLLPHAQLFQFVNGWLPVLVI